MLQVLFCYLTDNILTLNATTALGAGEIVVRLDYIQAIVAGIQAVVAGIQAAVPGIQAAVPGIQAAFPGIQAAIPGFCCFV